MKVHDGMASWNDGAAKQSILDFVQRVTTDRSPDFVPGPERIAVFDNDGTLWCEQPFPFQGLFVLDRIRALAPQHPEWKDNPPFKAAIENDIKSIAGGGMPALVELVMASHAGMTSEVFEGIVKDWLAMARHPKFKRPYTDLTYQPMVELLAFLRANDFKTFIVSGGGIEFMRTFSEKAYGVPPIRSLAAASKQSTKFGTESRCWCAKLSWTFTTIMKASRWRSISSSAAARSPPLAILTVISRCWNGSQGARGRVSDFSFTTKMVSASSHTTGHL